MAGFADEAVIEVASGNGGHGCVSFRREKYVAKGGPDGGDGGRGGDVYFVVKENLKTLSHLKSSHHFRAKNGQPGMGRRKHGKDGNDVEIEVPPGTLIKNAETGELIRDFTDLGRFLFLEGGKGGKGNWHFKTSTNQAPRYAQDGLPGEEISLKIELNIIADIGFVGLPNAGKSSLLSVITNANPKVGNYPFTTRIPNLGVMNHGRHDVILADIPGIIEGASHGAGLGIRFLKHISRTKALAFLIDLSDPEFEKTFDILCNELKSFSPELIKKPRIICGTKIDEEGTEESLSRLKELYPQDHFIPISSFTMDGIEELKDQMVAIVENSA